MFTPTETRLEEPAPPNCPAHFRPVCKTCAEILELSAGGITEKISFLPVASQTRMDSPHLKPGGNTTPVRADGEREQRWFKISKLKT